MKNKVVVITGASSGIGEALARVFSSKGARLVIGARRKERLEELASELATEVVCVSTDVSIEEDCKHLIDTAVERFGQIDVLINNAGISMRALFNDLELDVLKNVMDVNFWGTVYCTKYALPYIVKTKGSIVGVISIAGYVGLPGRTGYAASKFAVRGFLDSVRIENMHHGVHVLVAAPGFTSSEIRTKALVEDGSTQGETPRNESKMMSSETCANHILKAVVKRKRSIILTFVEGKFTVFLSKVFPSLLDRLTFNHMAKEPNSPFSK
ncbi:SDR family oxidoreductase [Halosquirtibacter xylanolyticus]|uniref:SDR family oxidoreductase n=1 Tax=Halosquirtibacter xylanolyticus TaxID=3374599 RepID=UPI00374A5142|nr:SDR family oxidoreductase [Prolixibacteraceae bacterium]